LNARQNEQDRLPRSLMSRLLRRGAKDRRRGGWGDMAIVAGGLALAAGCAVFPWYVFFNQEQFGIQAMNFAGNDAAATMPDDLAYAPERVRRQLNPGEIPMLSLDLLSTGTLPKGGLGGREPPLEDQPFPGEKPKVEFSLIHVANGRAMIEDAYGLWVVQKGSLLPDDSKVASIEKRDGGWVIVTDGKRVIPMSK
jgi:hypothetical protein